MRSSRCPLHTGSSFDDDDDVVALAPRDAIRVAPAVTRAFGAGPDGLELLAMGPRHPGDGEVFPGWWTDQARGAS